MITVVKDSEHCFIFLSCLLLPLPTAPDFSLLPSPLSVVLVDSPWSCFRLLSCNWVWVLSIAAHGVRMDIGGVRLTEGFEPLTRSSLPGSTPPEPAPTVQRLDIIYGGSPPYQERIGASRGARIPERRCSCQHAGSCQGLSWSFLS